MRFAKLTILILSIAQASGCAKIPSDSYCDIAGPIYFGDEASLIWLMEHDRQLVQDIVVNNETHAALCG